MIDHLGIRVRNFEKSLALYRAALEPLGYAVIVQFPDPKQPQGPATRMAGIGASGKPDFWLTEDAGAGAGTHLAFEAPDRASVDAFHRAALAAGARDNGAPGLREHYHPGYYGAFVHDLDGNNLEVVNHGAPAPLPA